MKISKVAYPFGKGIAKVLQGYTKITDNGALSIN